MLYNFKRILARNSVVRVSAYLSVGIAALAIALESPAQAQDAPQSDAVSEPVIGGASSGVSTEGGSDIVVTASRVNRSGFTAPTPTVVLGSDQIEQRAATNVSTILYETPNFRPSVAGSQASANPGAALVDLRGLGNGRTLTLMDGRRLLPSARVDLNQIPSNLISRVEVVTGGASAQWGSDAVAGVVNIITKNRFKGVELKTQGGVSKYGDYGEMNISGLAGGDFAGGAGHIVVAAEYTNNRGTGYMYSRPWGRKEYVLFNNPAPLVDGVPSNGMPLRWIASNVHLSTQTPGGIITSGPLKGTAFGPGGVPMQFNYGDYVGAVNMIGGDNYGNNFSATVKYAAPVKRYSGFLHSEYDVSDVITVFAEGLYAYSDVRSASVVAKDQGPVTLSPNASIRNPLVIKITNPFLPDQIRTAMEDQGLSYINLGRISFDMGAMNPRIKNKTYRLATGIRGDLGGSWHWDGYYQYGRNDYKNVIENDRIDANWLRSVNAVEAPDGSIVCADTLSPDPAIRAAAAGCQPANIFGAGSISPEAKAYTYGRAWARTRFVQHTAALNLQGEPFSTWGGPVSLATGIEYRRETQKTVSDAISEANGFNLGNIKAISGKFDVKEAYMEVVAPLATDLSWAKSLDLQVAGRVADYSSVGTVITWKVGSTWALSDSIRFRAGQSRDIRAPNIEELYSAPFFQTNTIIDPAFTAPANNYLINQNTVGNPNLKEEKADTTTVGVVLTPSFLPGFSASADYFKIKIKGAVSTLDRQIIVNRCAESQPGYCDFVIRDPATGRISSVTLTQINLGSLNTSGVDFELAYRTAMPFLPGDLTARFLGTYLIHKIIDDTLTKVDRAGEVGRNSALNGPRFRSNASLTYDNGGFSGTLQMVHVSGGAYDVTYGPNDILDNHVNGQTYFNLSTRYTINEHFNVFGVVTNLFNAAPPANPNSGGGSSPFTSDIHDVIGQRFTIGARINF